MYSFELRFHFAFLIDVVSTLGEIRQRLGKFDVRKKDIAFTKPEGLVSASVLVPLFIEDGNVKVLLTTRAKHLRTHAGLVAFPGGHMDEDDQSVISTALREAEEEIGLSAQDVDVLTVLPPAFVRPNKFVSLVVGLIPSDFVPNVNKEEVSKVFSLPLKRFLKNDYVTKEVKLGDFEFRVFFFYDIVDGEKIETWGFTAVYCMFVGLALCTSDLSIEVQKGEIVNKDNLFSTQHSENFFLKLKQTFAKL